MRERLKAFFNPARREYFPVRREVDCSNLNSTDIVLVAGGDGTVSWFVNLVAKERPEVAEHLLMVVYPGGSTNNIAKVGGMPKDYQLLMQAVERKAYIAQEVPYFKINVEDEDYFGIWCVGLGLSAEYLSMIENVRSRDGIVNSWPIGRKLAALYEYFYQSGSWNEFPVEVNNEELELIGFDFVSRGVPYMGHAELSSVIDDSAGITIAISNENKKAVYAYLAMLNVAGAGSLSNLLQRFLPRPGGVVQVVDLSVMMANVSDTMVQIDSEVIGKHKSFKFDSKAVGELRMAVFREDRL